MTLIRAFVFVSALLFSGLATAADLPDLYFVDAHSQMPRGLDEDKIIPLMDEAGVWHTILSARNDRDPQEVSALAAKHSARITAAVRSKGKAFNQGSPKFSKLLQKQLNDPAFKAVAEAILYHAQKGNKAPKIVVAADSEQNQILLQAAIDMGVPFIAHYEFAAARRDKDGYMGDFEAMVRAHPNHPFALIHMGQLDPEDAARLIAAYPNVHFMMSHSNPVTKAENSGQPWVNLFSGDDIAPKWVELMTSHPDRFILAFDNVWPEHWGRLYLDQAKLWRAALGKLPPDVAHALAHGNAERLWNIAPRQY